MVHGGVGLALSLCFIGYFPLGFKRGNLNPRGNQGFYAGGYVLLGAWMVGVFVFVILDKI